MIVKKLFYYLSPHGNMGSEIFDLEDGEMKEKHYTQECKKCVT